MDVNEIFGILSTIPTWAWVIGGFVIFAILFGDRKLWEFEVKFPMKQGVGRGEIELECHKKKGSSIEVEFQLEQLFQNKIIEVILNNKIIYTVPELKNNNSRIYINEKIDLVKPSEGDKVEININRQKQFEGVLVRD